MKKDNFSFLFWWVCALHGAAILQTYLYYIKAKVKFGYFLFAKIKNGMESTAITSTMQ